MTRSNSVRLLRRMFCLALIASSGSAHALETEKKTVADMDPNERSALAQQMESIANDVSNRKPYFADDPLPIHAKISLDPVGNVVVVDLDERLGPSAVSAEMEDLGAAISAALWTLLENIDGETGFTYLFGGHEAEYWLNDKAGVRQGNDGQANRRKQDGGEPLVVLSPGHGLYFHSGYKDWRAQRDPANGVLEDDVTPVIARQLALALQGDGVLVRNIREANEMMLHAESGQPWWRLAARYILEATLPHNPEIWHSLPNSTKRDRERDEDIRSRPYLANYLKADAILHVHTNADDHAASRGLRTIIHGRPSDRELAKRVLCSARELIHSSPDFENYPVSSTPHIDTAKGENRLATMPSVIVEVGFHTNQDDAALLLNPKFQRLAMRGVAKGYRLYLQGKSCGDFVLNPVPSAIGRVGYDVHLPISFEGNPIFPITVSQRIAGCVGMGCHARSKSFYSRAEVDRHRIQYLCTRDDLGKDPVAIDVQARDADGVWAKSATYQVACTR